MSSHKFGTERLCNASMSDPVEDLCVSSAHPRLRLPKAADYCLRPQAEGSIQAWLSLRMLVQRKINCLFCLAMHLHKKCYAVRIFFAEKVYKNTFPFVMVIFLHDLPKAHQGPSLDCRPYLSNLDG